MAKWLFTWSGVILAKLMVAQVVKTFLAFYGIKCPLPCAEGLPPLPVLRQPRFRPQNILKIHFIIILPSTFRCSKWSFRMFYDRIVRIYHCPCVIPVLPILS